MKVDNDFKMVIVVDDELPVGLKANTAAVLSLTLGNKIEGLIGKDLSDKSGSIHNALTTIPIPVLKCTSDQLNELYKKGYTLRNKILFVDVTDAAQTTKNYADYEEKLKEQLTDELKFLGVAIAGPVKLVKGLTGTFGLLR